MQTFRSIFGIHGDPCVCVCVCVKQCRKNPLHLDPSQSNSKITANLCSVSFLPLVCASLTKGFSVSIVYLWSWFKRTLIFAHSFWFCSLVQCINKHSFTNHSVILRFVLWPQRRSKCLTPGRCCRCYFYQIFLVINKIASKHRIRYSSRNAFLRQVKWN